MWSWFSSVVTLNKTCNAVCLYVFFFQSKSSLDQMESQSADAEPPPPPKPELRYPGLPRADTEGKKHTNTFAHLGSGRYITKCVNIWVLGHQVMLRYFPTCKQLNVFKSQISNVTSGFLPLREQLVDWSSSYAINVQVPTSLQQPGKEPHCPHTPQQGTYELRLGQSSRYWV